MSLLRRRRDAATPPAGPAIPDDVLAIADAPTRTRIRVRGQVIRMRARPAQGLPTLVVVIADGTARATVHWTGRRSIGGITLGRNVAIEGVATRGAEGLTFTNPHYTLLA